MRYLDLEFAYPHQPRTTLAIEVPVGEAKDSLNLVMRASWVTPSSQ